MASNYIKPVYEESNTTQTATWIKDRLSSVIYECSNCKTIIGGEGRYRNVCHRTKYCNNCGFRMTNPGYDVSELDYD